MKEENHKMIDKKEKKNFKVKEEKEMKEVGRDKEETHGVTEK